MFIREVELFERIPSFVMEEIAQIANEKSFPAEQVLFREGDFAEYLYILVEGQVALSIKGEESTTFPVNENGSVLGWSALVEPRRYTATAEFTMDSKVVRIDAERLLRVFERHPHEGLIVMRRLAGVIASRLVKSYQWLSRSRK